MDHIIRTAGLGFVLRSVAYELWINWGMLIGLTLMLLAAAFFKYT